MVERIVEIRLGPWYDRAQQGGAALDENKFKALLLEHRFADAKKLLEELHNRNFSTPAYLALLIR